MSLFQVNATGHVSKLYLDRYTVGKLNEGKLEEERIYFSIHMNDQELINLAKNKGPNSDVFQILVESVYYTMFYIDTDDNKTYEMYEEDIEMIIRTAKEDARATAMRWCGFDEEL